jgi:hypothetical protein
LTVWRDIQSLPAISSVDAGEEPRHLLFALCERVELES